MILQTPPGDLLTPWNGHGAVLRQSPHLRRLPLKVGGEEFEPGKSAKEIRSLNLFQLGEECRPAIRFVEPVWPAMGELFWCEKTY